MARLVSYRIKDEMSSYSTFKDNLSASVENVAQMKNVFVKSEGKSDGEFSLISYCKYCCRCCCSSSNSSETVSDDIDAEFALVKCAQVNIPCFIHVQVNSYLFLFLRNMLFDGVFISSLQVEHDFELTIN